MCDINLIANAVAEAYLLTLQKENGEAIFIHAGKSFFIKKDNLVDGLISNLLLLAKKNDQANSELFVHDKLSRLIVIKQHGAEITTHGKTVIDEFARRSIDALTQKNISIH